MVASHRPLEVSLAEKLDDDVRGIERVVPKGAL